MSNNKQEKTPLPLTSVIAFADRAPMHYLSTRNGRPGSVFLQGPPGCGKTQVASELIPSKLAERFFSDAPAMDNAERERRSRPNWHWSDCGNVVSIVEQPSTGESIDVRGIQLFDTDPETGEKHGQWVMPSMIKSERDALSMGAKLVVVIIDELTNCDMPTQKALTEILLNGRVGEFGFQKLQREGKAIARYPTWLIATGNNSSHKGGASKLLSILVNRVTNFSTYMPHDRWVSYERERGAHQTMLAYFDQHASHFGDSQPSTDLPFVTRRSASHALTIMKRFCIELGLKDDTKIPTEETHWGEDVQHLKHTLAGEVGMGIVEHMWAWYATLGELPERDEILADPDGAKCPGMSELGLQYVISERLITWTEPRIFPQLWAYAERLTKELQQKVAVGVLHKRENAAFAFSDERFNRWVADNAALISKVLDPR